MLPPPTKIAWCARTKAARSPGGRLEKRQMRRATVELGHRRVEPRAVRLRIAARRADEEDARTCPRGLRQEMTIERAVLLHRESASAEHDELSHGLPRPTAAGVGGSRVTRRGAYRVMAASIPSSSARRRGRAAGHFDVDGDHVRDAAEARVALAEDAAGAAAVADRDDELRLGRGVVGALERDRHVLRDGAGDEQQVGMARARDEADAEALDVVVRVGERVDLELAAVARAGIDLANGRAPGRACAGSSPAAGRRPHAASAGDGGGSVRMPVLAICFRMCSMVGSVKDRARCTTG